MSLFGKLLSKRRHSLFGRLRHKTKLSEELQKVLRKIEFKKARQPQKPIPFPTEEYVEMSGGSIELDVVFES